MSQLIYYCNECGNLFSPAHSRTGACDLCKHAGADRIDPSKSLGLVGFPASGKTVFLATLHDQVMHAAPEWRVRVSDRAFDELTTIYQNLRHGLRALATIPHHAGYFRASFLWRGQPVELLLRDAAGEVYYRLVDSDDEWDCPGVGWLLRQCPAVLVSTLCTCDTEHDAVFGHIFRKLLKDKNRLRLVVVLLIGADTVGDDAALADQVAREQFERSYRLFPGVLKNAGVRVEAIPLSNFGFGNSELKRPPEPYNVLEPLRRVLSHYLPWWRRGMWNCRTPKRDTWLTGRQPLAQLTPFEAIDADSANDPRFPQLQPLEAAETFIGSADLNRSCRAPFGTAFISYRRSGGAEAARLIRSELQRRGWRTFLDVEDLGGCHFDDRLLLEIQQSGNFIVVLSPGSLDRCRESDDWLRREIAHAIRMSRRIVPVFTGGFQFPSRDDLSEDIRELVTHNAVEYSHTYFVASMNRLILFLAPDDTPTDLCT